MDKLEELWLVVRSIEPGEVASYGAVGQALKHPASGWQVGRWMAQCPAEVPWWRVVAKSGALPVSKRDTRLGIVQADRLAQEGVPIADGMIKSSAFVEPDVLVERAARAR